MENIGVFVPENFQFLEVKFSIYLNRSVFVMVKKREYQNRSKFRLNEITPITYTDLNLIFSYHFL